MPLKAWREFIRLETSGGIVLLIATLLAIVLNNTPAHPYYQAFLNYTINSMPLTHWINEGLMTLFFLLVGLEIKRELLCGELSTLKKALLPVIAAVGGMLVPAIIYVSLNSHESVLLRGWAIPSATDIAFSLGILALLGKRVPSSLKIFLTGLAIIDDIGAIVIIAIFYVNSIEVSYLVAAVLLVFILFLLNRIRVAAITPYVFVGLLLWICVLKSGVHATLAGILLAFAIPLKVKSVHPLETLESRLHPWVIFGVIPLFAFANAGVDLIGLTWDALFNTVTLGIALGLFVGKQIGITLASWLAIYFGLASRPKGTDFYGIYGTALLGGIGFTMSLFIGGLAFGRHHADYLEWVRVGVIIGSLLSGIIGYTVLRFHYPSKDRN